MMMDLYLTVIKIAFILPRSIRPITKCGILDDAHGHTLQQTSSGYDRRSFSIIDQVKKNTLYLVYSLLWSICYLHVFISSIWYFEMRSATELSSWGYGGAHSEEYHWNKPGWQWWLYSSLRTSKEPLNYSSDNKVSK